jgi:hypothetical protein
MPADQSAKIADYAAGLLEFLGPLGLKLETRGRRAATYLERNISTVKFIRYLEKLGIKPTRTSAKRLKRGDKELDGGKGGCGCSIVASQYRQMSRDPSCPPKLKAKLDLSEAAVEQIWSHRRKYGESVRNK